MPSKAEASSAGLSAQLATRMSATLPLPRVFTTAACPRSRDWEMWIRTFSSRLGRLRRAGRAKESGIRNSDVLPRAVLGEVVLLPIAVTHVCINRRDVAIPITERHLGRGPCRPPDSATWRVVERVRTRLDQRCPFEIAQFGRRIELGLFTTACALFGLEIPVAAGSVPLEDPGRVVDYLSRGCISLIPHEELGVVPAVGWERVARHQRRRR